MVDQLISAKRRTVLSALGTGLLSSVVPGSAVASSVDTATGDGTSGNETNLIEERIEPFVIATNRETNETFGFESVSAYDPAELPGGEYRFEYRTESPSGPISATEIVEISDSDIVTASESGSELRVTVNDDKGIAPDGTLDVWVSTSTGEGPELEFVNNATIEFELIDPDSDEVLLEESTTTDDGVAVVELDLDVEEGEFDLVIEWVEEEITETEFVDVGPLVEFAFPSGPITVSEEAKIGISRTQEGDPVPGTIDIEIEAPDGSTETVETTINDGGVGLVEFTPESTGEYQLNPPETFGTTIDVQDSRLLTEGFRLRNQVIDEPIVFGGYIFTSDLSTADNTSIEVEIRERFGGDEVFETVETTTDEDGRFRVEFDPIGEADSYTVEVRSTDGQVIDEERLQLSEIEEDDDSNPDISVSIDEFSAAPGEEVSAEIELVDEDDEPINDTEVTVIEQIGFGSGSAYLSRDEVTTDAGGTTTYTTTIPETYIEDERFEVIAVTEVDGDKIESSDRVSSVISVSVDTDMDSVSPGETFEGSVTITEVETDNAISNRDFGVLYGRGNSLRGGNLGIDSATTDTNGSADFSFEVPDDLRYRFRFNSVVHPYDQISSRRTRTFSPFRPSIDVPDEVDPGESFTVSYSVDDHDAETSGMIFAETTWRAEVLRVDPGETVTLDAPVDSAGDRIRIEMWVVDENGEIQRSFDTVPMNEISEEPDDPESDAPTVVGDNPATDTTGDGLLNDVNGDGEFDITDVQVFFENLNDEAIQNNPEQFDFSGTGGDISISDVQALFEQL